MITYNDIQNFYKNESFTKENVDKNLIAPLSFKTNANSK